MRRGMGARGAGRSMRETRLGPRSDEMGLVRFGWIVGEGRAGK